MSRDNLGNKQTVIIHNCLYNDDKYDLVIKPHRQSVGYIRTKRHTLRKKIIIKQKKIVRKRFSKRRNASSESETTAIQEELHNLKDSKTKNHQIDDQLYLTDSETTSPASMKGKRRIKNCYTNKPIRLYNWNQPIRHIEIYTLTVIKQKNDSKRR